MSDVNTIRTDSDPLATKQVGVVPTAPKSVSSPNSTRDAVLLAFSVVTKQ